MPNFAKSGHIECKTSCTFEIDAFADDTNEWRQTDDELHQLRSNEKAASGNTNNFVYNSIQIISSANQFANPVLCDVHTSEYKYMRRSYRID